MLGNLLIVEDEKNTRHGLESAFSDEFEVFTAANADEALNLIESVNFDIILTDLKLGNTSGLSVIDKALSEPNKPICIMMTAYGTIETAVDAMKRGAYDFVSKPVNLGKLDLLIKRALKSRKIERENVDLKRELLDRYSYEGILGKSKSFVKLLQEVDKVSASSATVLLYGETGTGKELMARLIHNSSRRKDMPFVPVHCAALPANLLESELFGHEKGAFTGASGLRIGRFERADKGTLFLDEIAEIDATTQVKLLRFLETRSFERVGGTKNISVDLRLICATNKNLEQMVKNGEFREDLLYRLNVVKLNLPALKERKEDIELLLKHYLSVFAKSNNLKVPKVSKAAIDVLSDYNWPGNVRELRNFAENIIVMNRGNNIEVENLDKKFLQKEKSEFSVKEKEKILLKEALIKTNGNITKAAELLGINRRTIHRRLEKWPELKIF